MYYRLCPDHSRQDVDLSHVMGGPTATTCWIIGSGPSLADLPTNEIAASPAPKFGMNLAGTGLLRPNLWTSYDPTVRFHRSIYLDPSVMKFVHACRAMDLIPETSFKVCDAPNLYFFDRHRMRGFCDFPRPLIAGLKHPASVNCSPQQSGITDWQDSLIQAIDIAYQLGFRRLYLAGCELFIAPPPVLLEIAQRYGVRYEPREPLSRFLQRCRRAGATLAECDYLTVPGQYHFDEYKAFRAVVNTDEHYYRVTQYLRLARRSLALCGLELLSVTPHSRLNDYFPFVPVENALRRVLEENGDPSTEATLGRYTQASLRGPEDRIPMRDYRPHNWPLPGKATSPEPLPERLMEIEIPNEAG
jgi:hypothetical protein